MIEYIKGAVVNLTPASVTVETTGGVAYLLNISLNTYTSLEGKADARLFVHESIRDDAWVLYGFADEAEREIFRSLIGVSGVGAGTARVILSSHSAADLGQIITSGDSKALKQVKGVGAKTAERIIVDLRDKIKPTDDTLLSLGAKAVPIDNDSFDSALAALIMLGFSRQASQKALKAIYESDPTTKVEVAIKKALAMM